MKKRLAVGSVIAILVMALFALAALASDSEIFFSSDNNGQNRVTNIQEGDSVWIVVYDPDENIDCDVRDKIWTDIKIMDPKTGAYIVWKSYEDETGSPTGQPYGNADYVPHKGHFPGNNAGWTGADFLEETNADTGLFVSKRAFQIGTRVSYNDDLTNTHIVDNNDPFQDFQGGNLLYVDGDRSAIVESGAAVGVAGIPYANWLPGTDDVLIWDPAATAFEALRGRFENMDTLVGMYQDQNDETDVAVGMMKIIDTEATISWGQEIYKDANASATITIVDPDENVNCNKVEFVPVFILVNPGSWNPVDDPQIGSKNGTSPNSFCMLKATGGVDPGDGDTASARELPIRWYNIYDSQIGANYPGNNQDTSEGAYYVEYPVPGEGNVTAFDTVDEFGFCRVMFYASETGVSTGVFQLNLNSILRDLGFNSLRVRDVLVAYYLDPNDEDDFKISTAYIEERQHSITSFTNANRGDMSEYWIGRDPVYVQVIDANANVDPCCPEQVVVHICDVHGEDDSEWLILDETSSNSPVFFTNAGTQLLPTWDALGIGFWSDGYNLVLDNWKLEVFNEDSIYARYNDVYYTLDENGLLGLGDLLPSRDPDLWGNVTAFPPTIDRIRVANDVSFDVMEIGDTQVFDGSTTNMYFLDRQGNRVSGYVNSDCIFVEVIDLDQDEDQYRRERIDGFWDDGENLSFGPWDLANNHAPCGYWDNVEHPVNHLLGDTNIFSGAGTAASGDDNPIEVRDGNDQSWAKLYVLNPRNGRWAAVDLLETGTATGDFVSVTCIDLVDVYECVPTLGVLPGDTIVAAYQDPSNHSDSAWISIKVGIGGGTTPPSQLSTTMFVDSEGNEVDTYTDVDDVYVKVVDPSHAGAASLLEAVEVEGTTYDLAPLAGATTDTFITGVVDLELVADSSITATYTDPTDPTDTSSDTVDIIASELAVDSFYAGPNPFADEVTFAYNGTGIATTFTVTVYDLSGHVVWEAEEANVTGITWDGTNEVGAYLANGAYIYMVMATDGLNTFTDKGTVFINK